MEKAIITDYNIIEGDMAKQTVLKNGQVRFDFKDCYFLVEQEKYGTGNGLRINKIAKLNSNKDQIRIEPQVQNSLSLF